MQAHVLATQNMEESHTAENLQMELVVVEWKVSGRVSACVHYNAANIVKANQACYWESVCCFAHMLQLAINDGFKAVQILECMIGACSKLVAHFHLHHSTTTTQALAVKQKQMSVKEHALIQCCKTRWNSMYGMFERLTEQQCCAVSRSVTKPADARNLELKDEIVATRPQECLSRLKYHTLRCVQSPVGRLFINKKSKLRGRYPTQEKQKSYK